MDNTTDVLVHGWMPGPNIRGTGDVLWSCGMTILLCCWVSVYPNVGSPSDKWYHQYLDQLHLFCIALLGPDFLFAIAFGQWSKARESVKQFHNDPPSPNKTEWKYTHAFFVNSGGIHLRSPDFPQGFPVDAQQLHYLIRHDFVEFPDLDSMDISERNTVDSLSRLITVLQTLWFFAGMIQRVREGLPVTTLELTSSSFAIIMFATSAAWHCKPFITQPRYISTKDSTSIQSIREFSQLHTHPMLPGQWHRTPLEYISQEYFGINLHWSYYTRLAYMLRIRIFSRPCNSRPWDRFPSDTWLCPSFIWTIPATCVTVLFSLLFIAGWNFHFPTTTEKIMWRVCSVYHAVFSLYGACYYLIEMLKSKKRPSHSLHSRQHLHPIEERRHSYSKEDVHRSIPVVTSFLNRWRNTLPIQDPEARIPLRVLIPITVSCAIYVICRVYIYLEDFISLREQPFDVYISTDLVAWVFGP